ncbi:hypothetical protein BOX15_Mlig011670g1 [Macrostomum lignano]|uniref:Mitochondria-eating protein n=1 Tax=Macrostomum lignano TaxID=282301 RepID=A0A267GXL8_9PLAT|nr:hypothetical protein BOX15_Mlig011670g1 [Macrostomum lignano]
MAESLRRLVDIGSFSILQEKLEKWSRDYRRNTSDENVATACEIVELNARVQGQLFKLLSLCASEGGLYGTGAAAIRSRLLPLLGHGFFASGLSSDASLSVIADAANRERELGDVRRSYEQSLDELEAELGKFKAENEDIRAELEDTKQELDRQSRASASEKMFSEAEIRDLKLKLSGSEADNDRLRARVRVLDDYERQVRHLREEVAILQGRPPSLYPPPPLLPPPPPPPASRPRTPTPKEAPISDGEIAESVSSHLAYHGRPGPLSPLSPHDPVQRSRQQTLVARFNDAFSVSRLEAMETLRRYYDDQVNNQKIVYAAVLEAFSAAKLAFRAFKSKVRSQLLISHMGPDTLEEAVQDYINCHTDMFDLHLMVQDAIRGLTRNYRLYLPPGIGYDVLTPFLREMCHLAWGMSALAHPVDAAVGYDGELFDEFRYRRSYDSEFSATLVSHHIWPALVQGTAVLVKGEACTRRGGYSSRSRSASRSASPARVNGAAGTARSSGAGRTPRAPSGGNKQQPSARADLGSTARTASTSLSHYID